MALTEPTTKDPTGKDTAGVQAVVLADVPERQALRDLRERIEQARDSIGALDLEIETIRNQLGDFEASYHARLAPEHGVLQRIRRLARHMEQWAELLRRRPKQRMGSRAWRLERKRQREIKQHKPGWAARGPKRATQAAEPVASDVEDGEKNGVKGSAKDASAAAANTPAQDRTERLKSAFRQLARRFHPDLARTEEERLQFSELMSKINALYRAGDLDRLVSLAEQAKGAELDELDLTIEKQVELLQERLTWFERVHKSLKEERVALEQSATCELWRNVQQADAIGRNLIEELRHDLQGRIDRAYSDIGAAVRVLEFQVNQFNRDAVTTRGLAKKQGGGAGGTALEQYFDPYTDKQLVRLGLEQLAVHNASPSARKLAGWLEQEAAKAPAVLRLVLMSYISELSPFPLEGMESYDDIALRLVYLSREDAEFIALERALVESDDLIEFGVRRATDRVTHLGLRFRNPALGQAVPLALESYAVRTEFKRVLSVLGEHTTCTRCREEIFAVPLYRLRGLEDLRASVCPLCGKTLRSYWMPRGQDLQAVLNPAFIDFEIVSEWSFDLGGASIALQLVPCQLESMRLSDLKAQVVADVFGRHEIEMDKGHVQLLQHEHRVPERTPLEELEAQQFVVRFTSEAQIAETEALEILRHRIRTRFSGG